MLSILLVSEDPAVCDGLRLILKENNFHDFTLDLSTKGDEALLKTTDHFYDLLILDLISPMDMLGFIGSLKHLRPQLPIITYSFVLHYAFVKRYLSKGVKAYCFLQKGDYQEIINAIQHVRCGNLYISPAMVELIVNEALFNKKADRLDALDEREFEIFSHLVKGEPLTSIAEIFRVHKTTIVLYKSRILDKLRISDLLELRNMLKVKPTL